MPNNKLTNLLRSFNSNQLQEINAFLNSAKGQQIKNRLTASDKERLMREFSKINTNDAKRKIQNMSADEIVRLIKKL